MSEIEKAIEVGVPVQTAYNQWTQFESFPQFMEGVEEVKQLDATTLHWKAKIAGKREEWDAHITEQVPDQRIAWRSVSGAKNAGDVSFEAIDGRTRVHLHLVYEPEGAAEKAGDLVGAMKMQVEKDLDRFKKFIEGRGTETGAWREEVHQPAPGGTDNPERGKEASE